MGDFNNDGKDDIVAFHHGAWGGLTEVQVGLSNGSTGFGTRTKWTNGFCMQAQERCMTGDFNGDDKDDIITFHHGAWNGSKVVFVYLSNGSSFYYPGKPWHSDFCASGQTCVVGDVNGDGKDDVISFLKGPNALGDNGDVYVAFSNGSGFGGKRKVHKNICYGDQFNRCLVSDMNGDGKADLVAANNVSSSSINGPGSDVYVALSYGFTFSGSTKRHDLFMLGASDVVLSGRLNGDDKADLLTISPSSNRHKILLSYVE